MNNFRKIAKWVLKKPLILIRLDEAFSKALYDSQNGFEHLTIVKPHSMLQDCNLPTVCLLELREENTTECYLTTATRKAAVSTFETRLTLKKLRSVTPDSFQIIKDNISDNRLRNLFIKRIPALGDVSKLSPQLSARLIMLLARDASNHDALNTSLSLFPQLQSTSNNNWAQENAIHTALNAFGIRGNLKPDDIALVNGKESGLSTFGEYLYEDNVVRADASHLPGFNAIAPDVTGRAVFTKGDERMVVYTANKLPLEQMLGVDLIYVNETRGNIIMVQYKMLEEYKKKDGAYDWIFRPDKQLHDEIKRMQLPTLKDELEDYRLNRNPFFFKFVRRKGENGSAKSLLISLDHFNHILQKPDSKGPKGGIRITYDTLNGTYLREQDFFSLIRSGYVGTHRSETNALSPILKEVSKGNKAIVLAWQKTIDFQKPEELELLKAKLR